MVMAVNTECKHYIMQTVKSGDKIEKCRLGVNEPFPFACPENCLFFEPRDGISKAGWHVPKS
jgi:hypothetical protein